MEWTDRTSIEEAVAMHMTRAAGMPVQRVLCYGEHSKAPFNRDFSILMTRLPGESLNNSGFPLEIDAEGPWLDEFTTCVRTNAFMAPIWSIFNLLANWTLIRSSRVPDHAMGPFINEKELHEFLLSPASSHGFETPEEYEHTLSQAKKLQQRSHRITFAHGDFKAHNILVEDGGRLSKVLN